VQHNRLQGGGGGDDCYYDYEEPTSEVQLWQASTQWDNPQSKQHS